MIELTGVTYRYEDRAALVDVSLRISRGEFVVVVGANGSGKTTLLDVIGGLRQPTGGSVSIDGRPASENPVHVRTSIGRVFEDARDQLVGATVGTDVAFGPENLGHDRQETEQVVSRALAAVGMADRADDPIATLSGGERARVAIAGALAMRPACLALDEPTAGIDHPGRVAVLEHLEAVHREGVSLLLATHDLRDLQDAIDRIIGLEDGRVVLDDRPTAAVDRLSALGVRVPAGWMA